MGIMGFGCRRVMWILKMENDAQKGFTLIEIILAVFILCLLAGGIAKLSVNQFRLSNLRSCVAAANRGISSARELSRTTTNEPWGVKFISANLTIYKGTSYATRIATFDKTLEYSADCPVSGASEYTFNSTNGTTGSIGTTTFTSGTNTSQIQVNDKGVRF
jgi:prepilin-type N-terminal cleavage/methylation domain-containing protein